MHDTISGKRRDEKSVCRGGGEKRKRKKMKKKKKKRERRRRGRVVIDCIVLNRHMHRAFICGKSDFRLSGASRSFRLFSFFLSLSHTSGRFSHLDIER